MKKIYFLLILITSINSLSNAQCTITGNPINTATINPTLCTSFSGCTTIYIGNGINPTNLVMTADFDLTCLGPIQFIIRNNANIEFSTGNYDLILAANSSIVIETGGNIGAGSNCSASDLIRIGTVKVASCNGGGGAITDFPGLISGGGYNTVNASSTVICGSGTSVITAQKNPIPTSSTTYKFYTVATGGTPVFSSTVTSHPYTANYTTPVLSTSTTYYVEAVTGSSTTPRRAVTITVSPIPVAPTVTINQPTCTVATGSITITNPTGSGLTYSINGSTYTNTNGIFANVSPGNYNVTVRNSSGCTSTITAVTINSQPITPAQPTIGSITQPTCSTATGSFAITNYNASYIYTFSPSTGISRSGSSVTASPGNYTITASSGSCNSTSSATITINSQPVTPVQPTFGTVTQPTCSTATGSFVITNYNASYAYTFSPSTGVTRSGNTVTAPAGNYTVTATLNSCSSVPSANIIINSQPITPAQPTIGSIIHPTCSTTNGSFIISNYNASFSYSISPSTGVTRSGNIVTAPAGDFTVSATNGTCISIPSNTITINSQRVNVWNGTNWSLGSVPNNLESIIFNGNFSSTSDIVGCSCTVNSGIITINSGNSLIITNEVKVLGGSLTFENNASLVQLNNSAVNTGSINYKRQTTPLKQYDYTYWSSPLANIPLSQLATNSLFYEFNPIIGNWSYLTSGAIMAQGKGYIGRAPNGLNYATSAQQVTTNFIGTPNNGIITPLIIKSSTSGHNLIGNPYPSAIDIDLFLTDPINEALFNSTIYLWTHNTAITNNQYTSDDYAKYNLTGGVKTASAASTGGTMPSGKIAAGQGFFIETKAGLAPGSHLAKFDNSMRISGNNSQFYRNASIEKNRFWISINSPQGAFNEMLIGYLEGATDDFDPKYDGKTFQSNNSVYIAMPLNDLFLAIQGKGLPFLETDIIPFVYSTTLNGNLSIALEDFDGLFVNQNIYLFDNQTNTYHNLKESSYTFYSTSGTFSNRFELRFTINALSTGNQNHTDSNVIIASAENNINVTSTIENIKNVKIYDLLGKIVYTNNNVHLMEFNTGRINISPQILLVKIELNDGIIISRKIRIE